MASAIEQLAANIDFGAFARATELKKRIWFALVALVVYRLGTYIPVPGIDPASFQQIFNQHAGGILGMFNMLAGGALERMSIFALNVMPYISASIIIQLLTAVLPSFESLKKEGEAGRRKLNEYTRYLTLLLATVQAYGIAVGLEGMMAASGGVSAVIEPGVMFRLTAVVTLVAGTMFLMWLGEQITSRGIGNGISLIIFAGIVANLPAAFAGTMDLGRTGALSTPFLIFVLLMILAVIVLVVFMERAQRRILVQYPKRQMGNMMSGGDATHLPLKINTPGVIPPIFASSLLLLPLTLVSFSNEQTGVLADIAAMLNHGQPLYMVLYAGLIVFFCFFYTAVVFNPQETAENLRKYGGFVPGIRPGKNTADYFDFVLTRLTVLGSVYLAAVCLLPEYLIAQHAIPFYFGGTSLLIVVSVTMDTLSQVNAHLLAQQYEGLMKKARLRGGR